MNASPAVKKPRVIGIVVLCFLGGVLGLLGGLGLLGLISAANAASPDTVPMSSTIGVYLLLIVSVVDILAGILLLMYKRIGLYLAGASYAISVLLTIYNVATGNSTIGFSVLLGLLIDAAVLYYVYIYLTREPDKTFFS